jgi:hypothetical protein
MLVKLLKHEFKSTVRYLVPLYLILILLSVMDRIMLQLNIFHGVLQFIPGVITFLYVISIMAIFIVPFILLINRFYKNLTLDEGYLMFTLPVKTHQLIDAKLLIAMLWTVVSTLAAAASIFIVAYSPQMAHEMNIFFKQLNWGLHEMFGNRYALGIFEYVVLIISGAINAILLIYASIAIGHLFHSHKLIGSFLAYVGITTVLQIISTIGMAIAANVFHFSEIEYNSSFAINMFLPFIILIVIILDVVFYLVTNYIFSNKSNLE